MKKLIKLTMLLVIMCSLTYTKADAKTVSTSKSSISVNVGKTAKVKVKNAKKVKVKISKKIVKVSVKGKTIKIKGIKAGKTTLIVKAKKMKSKKIKVTVKKKSKVTEISLRKKMNGYGDKYKNNIESYPYLDKKSYAKTSEIYRYSLNQQWKAMPDYIRDCLVYNKTKIKIVDEENNPSGMAYGVNKIEIRNCKNKYKENISLIHEAAHIYDHYMLNKNIDIKTNLKNEFKKNKYKYGSYSSKNLSEFYANSVEVPILKNLKTISDEYILKIGKDNTKNIKIENRPGNSRHPGGQYIIVTINWPSTTFVELNDIEYINGMIASDYDEYENELVKNYYKTVYPNAVSIIVSN